MQDKLKEKWAVEITCLEDAQRLQALFPEYDCASNENDYLVRQKSFRKAEKLCYDPNKVRQKFDFDKRSWYKEKGYAIYTIEQLENLMK